MVGLLRAICVDMLLLRWAERIWG
ncbi:hypothetical protein [Escherichia coli]